MGISFLDGLRGRTAPQPGAHSEITADIHPAPESPLDPVEQAKYFVQAVDELTEAIKSSKRVAMYAAAGGVVALSAAFLAGVLATASGAEKIESSDEPWAMLIYELVRTAAGAALLAGVVWGVWGLTRAALDQATRFQKRYVAGHFLLYVLSEYEDEIKNGSIKIDEPMAVFKAWNDSVDSAYTNVRFGSRRSQDFSIAVSKDGVAVATGKATAKPPATPAEA